MRLIDRLERQQHDPDDGPQKAGDRQSVPKPAEIRGEKAPNGGAEATTGWEPTPRSDPGGDPATPRRGEKGIDGNRLAVAPIEETALAPTNGLGDRPAAESVAEPAAPRRSRRAARSGSQRPLKEGLRKGLSDERVWLQAQRDELETERAELVAEIEAEIGDIDSQIGHIDALLAAKPIASAEGASAPDQPTATTTQQHRVA